MFSFSYFLLVNFDPTKGFIKADSKSTLTHFIMNHHKLLTLIQSCQAILTFLVNRGLLAARRRCSCGDQMVLRDDKSDDGYHWECPVNQTQTIEGVWSQIKRKLKAMNGTVKSKLPSYLDEYNWRKCYPGDPFDNLLEAIAEFCPPN